MTCLEELFEERFERASRNFDSTAWSDQAVVVRYDVSGKEGGVWSATFSREGVTYGRGATGPADVTLSATSEDLRALFTDRLGVRRAILMGKLKVEGNRALLRKLKDVLG